MGLFDKEKSIYLIDSENVSGEWTEKIKDCKDPDEIYIFYSDNSKRTSMKQDQILADAEKNGAKVERIECGIGNNALDFQLSSHLGFCICDNNRNSKTKYYIVSNDKGYDPLIPYWYKEVAADIKRETVITEGDRKAAYASSKQSSSKNTSRKPSIDKSTDKKARQNKTSDAKPSKTKNSDAKASKPKNSDARASKPKTNDIKSSSSKSKEVKPSQSKSSNNVSSRWQAPKNDSDYIVAIGRSLKTNKKEQYHHLLVQIFGQDKGDQIFSKFKEDKDLQNSASQAYLQDLTKRQENIIRIFLYHEGKKATDCKKILTIIRRVPEDDKTRLHKELVSTFGDQLGTEYHNIYKGSLKVIKRL